MDLLLARGGCARYVANSVDGDGLTALHRAAAAGIMRNVDRLSHLLCAAASHPIRITLFNQEKPNVLPLFSILVQCNRFRLR
jgi:hypothetical protein